MGAILGWGSTRYGDRGQQRVSISLDIKVLT